MSEVPVKVFIRIRPLLGKELLQSDEVCLQVISSDQLVLGRDRAFTFDGVFPADSNQARVYEECVQPLVSSCLDGYNVTVLAYGQTGSGKSYTMGSEDTIGVLTSDKRGIIPRSLEELFNCIVSKKAEFQHTVHVSYLEIYKEELRDLLLSGGGGGVAPGVGPQELHIRETEGGTTVVMGVSEQRVCDAEEALGWLGVGNTARITAATKMNQRSSRSHAIFTVHIRQRRRFASGATPISNEGAPGYTQEDTWQQGEGVSSKFHFVDLAGSERASKTGNRGERFKESVHINTGLLALGNVISALSDPRRRVSHVPYRDSKITRLLKDSLGGNTSTVMITCLSPASANFAENLNSLKYSKRARRIQNRPVINRDPQSNKVQQMQEEIALLREELEQAKRETHLLTSSKPSTSGTTSSCSALSQGSKVMSPVENTVGCGTSITSSRERDLEGLSNMRLRLEELEECLNESNVKLTSFTRCLLSLKGKLLEGLEERGGQGGRSNLNNLLKECLELVRSCDLADGDVPVAMGVALESSTEEMVSNLRAELERCRADLKTDELAFAEKMEELAELQSTCDILSREKARAEAMWVAAQESEAELQEQVEQLQKRLADVGVGGVTREEEGVAREEKGGVEPAIPAGGARVGVAPQGSNQSVAPDESNQESVADESGEELSEDSLSGTLSWGAMEQEDFKANRSLMRGKVKTDSIEAFNEAAVLNSLRLLTSCLVRGTQEPGLAETQSHNLGDTRIIYHHQLPLATIQEAAESASSSYASTGGSPLKRTGASPSPPPQGRPMTPLEPSACGPLQSLTAAREVGVAYGKGGRGSVRGRSEMELLNESAMDSRHQLMHAEEKLSRAQEELRCLTIKIKLKEELIRELGKSRRTANKQEELYRHKIHSLEQEASVVKEELVKVQGLLQKHRSGPAHSQDSQRIIQEHQKKLAVTEKKLAALQKKQRDTERLASYGTRSERRIEELESGIERLRNQQESLRRKLKQQAEKKTRLENDLQKYQHRIQTLQTKSEHQKKVLRVKTEEAAAAQRKLRILSGGGGASTRPATHAATALPPHEEEAGLQAQRAWLESEVEKVLEERKAIVALEKDLEERERIVREREALVTARDGLERKKLQSQEDQRRSHAPQGKIQEPEKFEQLSRERGKLVEEHKTLQKKMSEGSSLSSKDQQMLLALNEQIQVLDAAIDFKNNSILSRKATVDTILSDSLDTPPSHTSPARNPAHPSLGEKLKGLEQSEVCALLEQYFLKVVELRQGEGEWLRARQALEVQLAEEVAGRRKAESLLGQVQLEGEKALLTQQLESDQHIKFLMQHIHDTEATPTATPIATPTSTKELVAKVKALEKDLYYYRKTSRDLKKKLQMTGSITSRGSGIGEVIGGVEEGVNSAPELEGGKVGGRAKVKSKRRKDADLGTGDSRDMAGQGGTIGAEAESKRLAGHEDIRTETRMKSGGPSAGISRSPLTKKHIHEVASIRAQKELRGQESPLSSEGSLGVVGSQVVLKTAEGGLRTAQTQVVVEQAVLQPVMVKRSRKELRQLSASDLAERQKRLEH